MNAELQDNPLLTERFPIQFDSIKAEHVEPAIHLLLEQMKRRIADLGRPELPRTYRDILLALDQATEPLDTAMAIVRHLESVVTTPELRAAYNAVQEPVSLFYTSIPLNADLWAAVKAVNESGEKETLAPVHKRFLKKTVSGFRRAGADLDAEGKKKLEELDVELTKTTTKFSEHVLDATNAFELLITDKAKLAGLPESARMAARESAKSKGKEGWRLTLQGPSYTAALTYLDDRSIRQQLWHAYNTRATSGDFDNRELIQEILRLRREKARLLDYRDFADLVLEERMAHNGGKAQAFIETLWQKTKPFFERENQSLTDFGQTIGYDAIHPWDIGYLAEKQRQALYEFDEEELRPYFELDRVVAGMFEIFSRVLGIKVLEEPGVPGWDKATKYYRVEDAESGELLGGFYTDWFPRENKRGGAWMDSLITGDPDQRKAHLGLICGNLTPPLSDKPSLLTHREVETIFHEFGHLLHHVLSRVPVRTLSGTNVPWDFVELPSQIMENWCMERDALHLFARQYQTGTPIPDELFEKMKRARTFRAANAQMRQLGFGMVDLKLHREYEAARDGDVIKYARNILAQFSPADLPDDYAMIASFTHLFASPVAYGAGYYSYKWAEVLDADAFTRFQDTGIFNTETGCKYRHNILERGDSEDPAQLYRDFMGRDPDSRALLERLGLREAA
ncbi:MAG: M3 family metallopeptidase [Acidobacteriaceae bacterium]|nr:M3 family metallopeptidase [Acidobacteriaceae bacterium]MBV9503144.1 M3 family metallopeptidase [Acidobacteriaceae bacterium]